MYHCFTLNNLTIEPGIKPDAFDCLVPSFGGDFQVASVKLLPVLPYTAPTIEYAHLSLAFIKQEPNDSEVKTGAIVAVNPLFWSMCIKNSGVMLLDPCGSNEYLLLFLPPSSDNLLTYNDSLQTAPSVICTDATGTPFIRQKSQGELLIESLGLQLTEVFPAQKQEETQATSRSRVKRDRKTLRAALSM